MRHSIKFLSFVLLLSAILRLQGQNLKAASCAAADVQNALNSASTGATISVPAGSCSWSGVTLAKAVTLKGAGVGATNITPMGNNYGNQAIGRSHARLWLHLSIAGGGNASKGFTVSGSWQSAQPVIFENNAFSVNGAALFLIAVPGA